MHVITVCECVSLCDTVTAREQGGENGGGGGRAKEREDCSEIKRMFWERSENDFVEDSVAVLWFTC